MNIHARILITLALTLLTAAASADVWKWVDANGKTHFVDTMVQIYTWQDEEGKVHYSNTPDHKDAVAVELVWHSSGKLETLAEKSQAEEKLAEEFGETEEQRASRVAAEELYCKRANEIYESYVNAPQLYETSEKGKKVYLDEKEAAAKIKDIKEKRDQFCPQFSS